MPFVLTEGSYPNTGANGLFSAVALNGTIIGVGSNGLILRTVDNGANWTQPTSPSTNTWHGIATDGTNFVIVGVGTGQRTAISTDDGVTWSANASADETANWQSVCYADTLGRWVAVASNGTTRTMESTNGTAWTGHAAATAKQWQGVAWSNQLGLLVASAFDASTTSLMSSTNATAWTSRTSVNTWSGTRQLAWESSVGAFAEIVDVSGGTHVVATSTTGTSGWAAQTIPNNTEALSTLTAAPSLGLFVVTKGCFPNVGNPMSLVTSDDGTTWTETEYSVIQDVFGWNASCWDESQGILFAFSGTSSSYKTLTGFWATLGVLSPSTGTKDGGTVVTITGTGLSNVAQGDVLFDGTAALSVTPAADGLSLTCITPAHAVGAVDVVVTGIGTLTAAYTFVSVTKVTPNSGTFAGGQAVTITGFGFDLATGVTFDGVSAGNIVYVSNTTITATTPVHGAGFVTVAVVGVGSLVNGYEFVIPVEKLPPYPYYTPLNQDGKANADLISGAWARWLTVVKERVENPVLSPSTQVPASSVIGVLNENNIPQLPFTRIDLTHAPRLLGRTSAGAGPAEEITVTGGLTLNNGQLSIFGLIGGFTVGDILYADSVATLARLNDVSVGSYLRSGGVATAPLWSTLKLPNAATSGAVVFATAANTYGEDATNFIWNNTKNVLEIAAGTVADGNLGVGVGVFAALIAGGARNTALGYQALAAVSTGTENTAIGWNTLTRCTIGVGNFGIGGGGGANPTLGQITSGSFHVAIGTGNVGYATTVDGNTAIGHAALRNIVTGDNTAVGRDAMLTAATTADQLAAFGAYAGREVSTGTKNTFIGFNCGRNITTGGGNTLLGANIQSLAAATTNNIALAIGDGTIKAQFNGSNWALNTASFPSTGTAGLVFPDGTALASMASNTAAIYAEDVAGTVKMFAIAEDGTGGEILTTVSTIPYTSIGSVPTATVLGRNTAGTGAAEALGTLPSAVQLNITSVGTVTAGIWNAGAVTSSGAIISTLATGNSLVIDTTTLVVDATNNVVGMGTASPLTGSVLNVAGTTYWSSASVAQPFTTFAPTSVWASLTRPASAGGIRLRGLTSADVSAFIQQGFMGTVGGTPTSPVYLFAAYTSDGGTAETVVPNAGTTFRFQNANTVQLSISGAGVLNVGGTGYPSTGTNAVVFSQGTALSSMASNTAGCNAVDVGGTAQLFGTNEANESYQITAGGAVTPRDFAPGSFTIQTGRFVVTASLTLSGSEAVTINGTGRLIEI